MAPALDEPRDRTLHARDNRTRQARDRGAANSLTMVLLTPMFVVVGFAAFQAALWSHARTEARVVARDTAALVARSGVGTEDARAAAEAILTADTSLRDVRVEVVATPELATVTVRGDAPGIIRGSWSRVEVVTAVPVERWVQVP